MPDKVFSLRDDPLLLRAMMSDAERRKAIYEPGPYWARKAKFAVKRSDPMA